MNTARIHSIITTKTPDDWSYIKKEIEVKYNQDISNYVPVFLTLKDFAIHFDPSFKAADIVSSWWSYGKMPVILLKSEEDWDEVDDGLKIVLQNASATIK